MPRPGPRVETRSRLAGAPRVRQAPPFAGHALTAVSTRPCWARSGRRSHWLRRHTARAGRSVEDGERAVGILSNLHACLDVMGSRAALRQLQLQPLIATVLS